MKILRAASAVEDFALTRPYAIAGQDPIASVGNVIVRVETENGLVGLGAASPGEHVTGETLEACRAAITTGNLAWLVGRDARTLPLLCREAASRTAGTPAARAAIDIALHDLVAQHLGVPLVEMLGRAHRELPTSITIGIKSVAETVAEGEEYVGRGFRVLKVKIGDALDVDLERLRKLREGLGTSVTIRVDANIGYTVEETARFFERTAGLAIEFVEQPVPREAFGEIRTLTPRARARIAADESLHDEKDALALAGPPGRAGLRHLQHQAHEVRRCPAGDAHRRDRRDRRHLPHVGLHGREPHLDRRGAARGLRVAGDAVPRPRRLARPRPRRRGRRLHARGRRDAHDRRAGARRHADSASPGLRRAGDSRPAKADPRQ